MKKLYADRTAAANSQQPQHSPHLEGTQRTGQPAASPDLVGGSPQLCMVCLFVLADDLLHELDSCYRHWGRHALPG